MSVVKELDFPRGKSKSGSVTKKRKFTKEKDIFQIYASNEPAKKKKKKKVTEEKKCQEISESYELKNIASLSFKNICPGMLLLGSVKKIEEYGLLVNLPGGNVGFVAISSISDAFNLVLQEMVKHQERADELSEQISTLNDMFFEGMLLRCKVIRIVEDDKQRKDIELTINPREIYEYLSIEALQEEMILTATVISQEDHGYQMDIGIANAYAFANIDSFNMYNKELDRDKPLSVGQYIYCGIKKISNRAIELFIQPSKIQEIMPIETTTQIFHHLYPGMHVLAKIIKVENDGLYVEFFSFQGFIHVSHLKSAFDTTASYFEGEEVIACLLYIYPVGNVIALSLKTELYYPSFIPNNKLSKYSYGDILENCKIITVREYGVYMKITKSEIGFVPKTLLADEPVTVVHEKFSEGQICRGKVLNKDYLENHLIISMQESILKERYLGYKNIEIGEYVEAKVIKFFPTLIVVKLTTNVFGVIPWFHCAEVPFKNPEKKFAIGDNVKCRVLRVIPEKQKLSLTCKRSLMSKKFPIISNYEDIKCNDICEGVIALIKPTGLLIHFFNAVKGWVPINRINKKVAASITKSFFVGQLVKCRVINVLPEMKQLILSLQLSHVPLSPQKPLDSNFNVGQFVNCKVVKKENYTVTVSVMPSGEHVGMHYTYLSDYISHCHMLYDLFEENEDITNCMVFTDFPVILTKKNLLMESEKQGYTVKKYEDLSTGMILTGVVKKIEPFGVIVIFPNGLLGVAFVKNMTDEFVICSKGIFKVGQTVVAKIVDFEREKRRLILSLRLQDCFNGDIESSLDYLQRFLEEKYEIQQLCIKKEGQLKILAETEVGRIINVTVDQIISHGIICKTDTGISGVIIKENMADFSGGIGTEVSAVVLFVDFENKCLELSLDIKLIKDFSATKKNSSSSLARISQKINGNVVLIKDEFILIALQLHAKGTFAYMPAKKNCNDYLGKERFYLGMSLPVIIQRCVYDFVLVSVRRKVNTKNAKKTEDIKKSKPKIKLGKIYKAIIKRIKSYSVLIDIEGIDCFIHISRITDKITYNSSILATVKVNQEVTVRVINLRSSISYQFSKLLSDKEVFYPECTMKESELHENEISFISKQNLKNYVGKQVHTFLHSFDNNGGAVMEIDGHMEGYLDLLDYFTNLVEFNKPQKFLKIGFCYLLTVKAVQNHKLILCLREAVLKKDEKIHAYVEKIVFDSEIILRLPGGYKGIIPWVAISDDYDQIDKCIQQLTEQKFILCHIVLLNEESKTAVLSLRSSRFSKCQIQDPEINSSSDILGKTLRGFVESWNDEEVIISLGIDVKTVVPFSKLKKIDNFNELKSELTPGTLITVKVTKMVSNKIISEFITNRDSQKKIL